MRWCREDPPGGCPLAALAAGLALEPRATVLVALAGDQPFAGTVVPRLIAALESAPAAAAALAVDPDGRQQPLLAAYRVAAVRDRLAGDVAGRAVRSLARDLPTVTVAAGGDEAMDVDTPQDFARPAPWRTAP